MSEETKKRAASVYNVQRAVIDSTGKSGWIDVVDSNDIPITIPKPKFTSEYWKLAVPPVADGDVFQTILVRSKITVKNELKAHDES